MADKGMMKVVRIEEYVKDLNQLSTTLVPIPTFPPPRSKSSDSPVLLLIRVTHTSPTHVDTLYARGLHQNNHSRLVHPPFTLGLEFTGVIVDIHPRPYPHSNPHSSPSSKPRPSDRPTSPSTSPTNSAPSFQKGDQVWGTHLGCFAGYIVAPAAAVHHLPPSLSLFRAAGLGASTGPVSYGALCRVAGLKRGETALIHAAAGGLGVAAVRIAMAVGANVIATVGSQAKKSVVEDMLRRSGGSGEMERGSGVVRYDVEGWEKEVIQMTGDAKGVDVVFDTVGLVRKSIRCCRFGGRVVIVGFVGRGGEMEQVAMNHILLRGVKVFGYRFGETMRQDPEENRRTWDGFGALVEKGGIEPVVYRTYRGLDFVRDAVGELAERKVYGKIVIEVVDGDVGGGGGVEDGGEDENRIKKVDSKL